MNIQVSVADDDRIMSCGERILPEHYVTFLEALKRITGLPWEIKKGP